VSRTWWKAVASQRFLNQGRLRKHICYSAQLLLGREPDGEKLARGQKRYHGSTAKLSIVRVVHSVRLRLEHILDALEALKYLGLAPL
jgi:hypothetical protein